MKILGAVLILCGSVSVGWRLCRFQSRRLLLLRELLSMLEQLQGELELRSPPLPDLFTSLFPRFQDEVSDFLRHVADGTEELGEKSFAEIWRREVLRRLPSLSASEQDELICLGKVLGRLDLETELQALEACRRALGRRLEQLRDQAPAGRRLILGLSAAAGILTVILMI